MYIYCVIRGGIFRHSTINSICTWWIQCLYICLWSNWLWKNLYYGMYPLYFSSKKYVRDYYLYFTLFLLFLQTGPDVSSKVDWGVNYRALNDLFHISQSRKSSIMYEVGVQMVEIYNEQVRDLLSSDGSQKRYPFLQFNTCFKFICEVSVTVGFLTLLLEWMYF